jgi:hypothetical protein
MMMTKKKKKKKKKRPKSLNWSLNPLARKKKTVVKKMKKTKVRGKTQTMTSSLTRVSNFTTVTPVASGDCEWAGTVRRKAFLAV